jgi:hypothetical protein
VKETLRMARSRRMISEGYPEEIRTGSLEDKMRSLTQVIMTPSLKGTRRRRYL